MKALACRLYGEYDLRLEPMELEPAGEEERRITLREQGGFSPVFLPEGINTDI